MITTAIEELAQLEGGARAEAIAQFVAKHPDLASEAEREALSRGRVAGSAGATPEQVLHWSVATDLAKAYRRKLVESTESRVH